VKQPSTARDGAADIHVLVRPEWDVMIEAGGRQRQSSDGPHRGCWPASGTSYTANEGFYVPRMLKGLSRAAAAGRATARISAVKSASGLGGSSKHDGCEAGVAPGVRGHRTGHRIVKQIHFRPCRPRRKFSNCTPTSCSPESGPGGRWVINIIHDRILSCERFRPASSREAAF